MGFKELRLMVESLQHSIGAFFWTLVMLFLTFFIFGLVTMQGIGGYLSENEVSDEVEQELQESMRKQFGSIWKAMVTLYASVTDGWVDYYELMLYTGSFYSLSFLFFTAFFHIAVLNVATGLVIDKVTKLAEPDIDEYEKEQKNIQRKIMQEVKTICRSMDTNNNGKISWEELQLSMQNHRVASFFSMLDLNINHTESFYCTLAEMDDDDEVDVDCFVEGCMRMKGPASSIDLHIVSVQLNFLGKHVKEIHALLDGQAGLA